jgi:hypothetical protein
MKKIAIISVVVSLVLLFTLVSAALAHEGDVHECHWESGLEFGQHHADHARAGELGGEHNPGNHQGYSICVP